MINVSFSMTLEAYKDRTMTETRRFWKPSHAEQFKPGMIFMGIDKDSRHGGKPIHAARVVLCRRQRLADMSHGSFERAGGTLYWKDREAYIEAMGGPDQIPYVLRFEHIDD